MFVQIWSWVIQWPNPFARTLTHVVLKCIDGGRDGHSGNNILGTEDRISCCRRAFNVCTSVGIKRKGICMAVCTNKYWPIIIPVVTYGNGLRVMKGKKQKDFEDSKCVLVGDARGSHLYQQIQMKPFQCST